MSTTNVSTSPHRGGPRADDDDDVDVFGKGMVYYEASVFHQILGGRKKKCYHCLGTSDIKCIMLILFAVFVKYKLIRKQQSDFRTLKNLDLML